MDPADSAHFPTFTGSAHRLFRPAETETLETLEENLPQYEEENYTYIPLPESNQYYDRNSESLKDLSPNQYLTSDIDLRELFQLLAEEPFLLKDTMDSLEVHVVSEFKYYLLPEEATDDAVAMDIDEVKSEYPTVADDLLSKNPRYRFVDIADLNRREVREAIFPIIAELESELAEAIKQDVDNPVDLYHNAPERVVGRREKDLLNDIELHTAEYLGLGEMIGLLKGRGHLWDTFGFESSSEVEDRLNSIKRLRNRVMHSNRTLIRSQEDVAKTLERIEDAQKIIAEAKGIPLENIQEMNWK